MILEKYIEETLNNISDGNLKHDLTSRASNLIKTIKSKDSRPDSSANEMDSSEISLLEGYDLLKN